MAETPTELEQIKADAERAFWPMLVIDQVPPETLKRFMSLTSEVGPGGTMLDRLELLIHMAVFE